ncbi:YibE/F family protein [Candidatus Woesebacteria bacterium]|nr:YibE/F family protein [Candidatus Woesebacteria bacterium]
MKVVMRQVILLLGGLFLFSIFVCPTVAFAQESSATESANGETNTALLENGVDTIVEPKMFEVGVVIRVLEEQTFAVEGTTVHVQRLEVQNNTTGEISEVQVGNEFQPLVAAQKYSVGDKIILSSQTDYESNEYTVVVDRYRIPILVTLVILFFITVTAVGGIRGALSILGMFATFGILGWFLLPQILAGANPVTMSVVAAIISAAITIYLAHGWCNKSHVAFGSIVVVLGVVIVLSNFVVKATHLLGLGDEQAYFLQFAEYGNIHLQGLFLAGIIIGAFGVLDDIVVAQVSVVGQLLAANKKLSRQELYFSALEVGKDHVASLVNTLVLAYAGTSLPLFLLVFVDTGIPLWVKINDQVIAEEIVRTLTGSIGLVLAVPVTTLLAVFFLDKKSLKHEHIHTH